MSNTQDTNHAPTLFQQKVYDACSRIPSGRVTTYQLLARSIGCGSARAVGQALRRNPYAPRVPCHRVIASDLTLGGYEGQKDSEALSRKIALLASEGVMFQLYQHSFRLSDHTLLVDLSRTHKR